MINGQWRKIAHEPDYQWMSDNKKCFIYITFNTATRKWSWKATVGERLQTGQHMDLLGARREAIDWIDEWANA